MNFLARVSQRMRSLFENRSNPIISQFVREMRSTLSIASDSGVKVTESSAMKLAVVMASIATISGVKGSLPKRLIEVSSGKAITDHPVAELLWQPNGWQDPLAFDEYRAGQILGWGNAFSEIIWAANARPIGLITHHASNVGVSIDYATATLRYEITDQRGRRSIDSSRMLHTAGFSLDGIVGVSTLRQLAQAIGVGLSADKLVSLLFKNKALPGIVITTDKVLGDIEFAALQAVVEQSIGGDNVFRPLLLEGGAKATTHTIPLDEALLVTAREFQGREIACRGFRLPPRLAGYAPDGSTEEEDDRFFVKYCLGPLMRRDEEQYERKLFATSERGRFRVKHVVEALLRGDIQKRYEAHKTAILSGFLSRNEVRELEDREPVEGGDELLLPQSIFGKPTQDNGGTSGIFQTGAQPDGAKTKKTRDRFEVLLTRTVAGLANREVTNAKRLVERGDPSALGSFYDQHAAHLRERLCDVAEPSDIEQLVGTAMQRRDLLLKESRATALVRIEHWAEQITAEAASLLESTE